jgi:hypothetical protein
MTDDLASYLAWMRRWLQRRRVARHARAEIKRLAREMRPGGSLCPITPEEAEEMQRRQAQELADAFRTLRRWELEADKWARSEGGQRFHRDRAQALADAHREYRKAARMWAA